MVGVSLAVWAGISARGAELLGMPTWVWYFALIACAGSALFYGLAHKMGDTSGVRIASIGCGIGLLAVGPLFFLTGFVDGLKPLSGGESDPFGRARLVLGPLIAWLSLVVVPGIAFVANGCVVLALHRARR